MMIPYVRQQKIVEELEKRDMLFIDDLVNMFSEYSESTIRRDLKALEDENAVTLLRGGGIKLKRISYEAPTVEKLLLNNEEKEKIARIAASTVKDDEVIYIDSGTTTLNMLKYITADNVEIITTNTHLLSEQPKSNIKSLITLSGEINFNIGSIAGTMTDEALSAMYFDKAYLGANGFGFKAGINTPDVREATKKQIIQNNSSRTYVLADYSKYKKRSFSRVFELKECILITDRKIDEFNEKNYNYLYN